jgi:putative membrane protein (TIGR04086 family)
MVKNNLMPIQNITSERDISIVNTVKGVLIAYIITIIIFLIFAVIITYSDFPEGSIPTIVVTTTILSIMLAGGWVARRAKSKGWLNGAILGIAYMIILYIISAIALTGFVFDRYVMYMLSMGFFSGAFGGITGINIRRKSYKKNF